MPDHAPARDTAPHDNLATRYAAVRAETEVRVAGLCAEDQQIQSMPDTSPAKWHRAHTSWFFETFVLRPHCPGYAPFEPAFSYLFNSYYVAAGDRHARPARGLITRPTAADITAYRQHVDRAIETFIPQASATAHRLIELGLQHEQQHQELLWTDILHGFAQNPLAPAVLRANPLEPALPSESAFVPFTGGLIEIGASGERFCFDNETPRHLTFLTPFQLANSPVLNSDFAQFIADGGYDTAALWMSEGFEACQQAGWRAPLYWRPDGTEMTLTGPRPRDPAAAVRHISWYEADAFARWAGARLPTEAEWEHAATASTAHRLAAMTGSVWQWTLSPYSPYPGFQPAAGAIGEYNGKFMINQMVLRGGSLATPAGHTRPSYRNFFHPEKRWQFSGVRLAKNGI
jgi:ergothioneine biosynthesis protein EgtB